MPQGKKMIDDIIKERQQIQTTTITLINDLANDTSADKVFNLIVI